MTECVTLGVSRECYFYHQNYNQHQHQHHYQYQWGDNNRQNISYDNNNQGDTFKANQFNIIPVLHVGIIV